MNKVTNGALPPTDLPLRLDGSVMAQAYWAWRVRFEGDAVVIPRYPSLTRPLPLDAHASLLTLPT